MKGLDVEKLIENLQGTCNNLQWALQEVMEGDSVEEMNMTEEQTNALYMEIFLCGACGWWFETCEESDIIQEENGGDRVCESCAEDYDEESDILDAIDEIDS